MDLVSNFSIMAFSLLLTFSLSIVGLSLPMSTTAAIGNDAETDRRLFVNKNFLGEENTLLAFYNSDGRLKYTNSISDSQPFEWVSWIDLGAPSGVVVISNPVGLHTSKNQTQVFSQASDGQIYTTIQQTPGAAEPISFGRWAKVSATTLDFQKGVSLNGLDSVSVGFYKSQIVIFARTISNESNLFWCRGNDDKFSAWERIGDATPHLISDATVILNTFSEYYEAFAVMSDGSVYRTWQRNDNTWKVWRSMGLGQPSVSTISRPVAIVMSRNFWNGALQVFCLGADGAVKQIWQTTCDGLDDLWGYCTWGLWYGLADQVPSTEGANVIMAGTNIHLGGELFAVDPNGGLWYSYQLERGVGWYPWQQVNGLHSAMPIINKPYITRDDKLWWKIFGIGRDGNVVVIEQTRSLNVKPSRVASGTSLIASWSVPIDEATGMDWIGIYPAGADNDQYVDFMYVQGGQNPTSSAIPQGTVDIASLLPDGKFDVRYLVNRQFVNVISKSVEFYNGSHELEWIQVYKGIFFGLGLKNTNINQCVKDGNKTLATFRQSFQAFSNGEIFKGLRIFGDALKGVKDTLIACLQTDIAKALEKFIKDLLSCYEGECVKFVIDTLDILLILYNDRYEIFGDIRATTNAFNLIEGYEQGGLCIGRVINACLN